ncbi:hypothetical protein L915_16021 [Phytophthora nicotianae]|uniref:Uncharacterized protein n=1 Tax=Phytophthora nicotianae TaxID=4792 RepID=W2G671_PHYNI|nr:hypothetical protein L915_16021 [Phytophthora nicotianae]ETL31201.1 hypothetical protein L916_15916 [Phytophthora nicotianae]
MASSSAPYVTSPTSTVQPSAPSHDLHVSLFLASNREHVNPLQQRAAAAAQALLAPGRSISQREIQAMLEKNEAALKGWNALHKQQPAKANPVEHKEWVRRCLVFRQQIGARLEVLASLADKQIAQEDEKTGGRRISPNAAASRQAGAAQNPTLAAPIAAVPQILQQPKPTLPQQVYAPQTMSNSNPVAMATSTSASMAMPNMAAPTPPTMFPEPPMPTVGFATTSSSMFFPTGQMNPMQTSTGFTSSTSMVVSGVSTSTQGYAMSSGVQTFTPNAYMSSTSGPPSSSASFMNQQNYMMGGGMMNQQQQFMPMPMPMNLTSSGNMYDNTYGMSSASTSTNSANGNNSSSNNFSVDPFMTPLGFGPDTSFGSTVFPMTGMPNMPMQQQQMMGSINGINFGAQGASMMPNNFGYGGLAPSSAPNMMQQAIPTQQFQPTPQSFQQQNQLPVGSMSMSPDSALYGDSNVNIFEGLTDDAFFPMQ